MKLYEMLQLMGDEHVGAFMAIRTVTQRPCSYFMDRADALWDIMDLEYPELIREADLHNTMFEECHCSYKIRNKGTHIVV